MDRMFGRVVAVRVDRHKEVMTLNAKELAINNLKRTVAKNCPPCADCAKLKVESRCVVVMDATELRMTCEHSGRKVGDYVHCPDGLHVVDSETTMKEVMMPPVTLASAPITAIKPRDSSSVLTGLSSGVHPSWPSEPYRRDITTNTEREFYEQYMAHYHMDEAVLPKKSEAVNRDVPRTVDEGAW